MLMQNFKSAADLGITEAEQAALIKVLGMLERGDLVDVAKDDGCENGFYIGTWGHGCGTPACIGGWAAALMNRDQKEYVSISMPMDDEHCSAIGNLYWGYPRYPKPGVAQSALALRSYLTTGDARWDLAVA